MVLSAAEDSSAALERLCQDYWRPLYGYARRSGRTPHDAEDAVQSFLSRMLERQWLRTVQRDAGPFRHSLQRAFRYFLLDDYDRATAKKRGGGAAHVTLDAPSAEILYAEELADTETPEKACERAWALEIFTRARAALRAECEAAGRAEMHDALESSEPRVVIAARLGVSEGALNSFAHRVRRRLLEHIRREIMQTVNSPSDFEEEVAAMLRALGMSR